MGVPQDRSMNNRTVGARIRQARLTHQWTQRLLAAATEISPARLSQLETDRRYPTVEEWRRLKSILPLGRYQPLGPGLPFPLRPWRAIPPPLNRVMVRPLCKRLAAARHRFGLLADRALSELSQRDDAAWCERFLHQASLDSGHELLFWTRLLVEGARPVWYAPAKAGYRRLTIVDSETLANVSDIRHPCLEFVRRGYLALIFPQVTVSTGRAQFRLDALACLRRGRHRYWLNLEVDGEGHDCAYDSYRQSLLGLQALRLTPADLAASDFGLLLDAKLWPFLEQEIALFRAG